MGNLMIPALQIATFGEWRSPSTLELVTNESGKIPTKNNLYNESLQKQSIKYNIVHIFIIVFGGMSAGQISIIPKPELRGFGGSSLIKPPFRVTSADVVIICPDVRNCQMNYDQPKQISVIVHLTITVNKGCQALNSLKKETHQVSYSSFGSIPVRSPA